MVQPFPTLYKKDTSGKIRTWQVILDDSRERYATVSGVRGGAPTQTEWTKPSVKNVGRANATTLVEQAYFEAESLVKKKLKTGYSETLENVDHTGFVQCTLAKEYGEHIEKLIKLAQKEPVCIAVQPKLDGIRCLANPKGMVSRRGEKIVSCSHIQAEVNVIFPQNWSLEDVRLDGELYNHDLKDDFSKIVSLVRKSTNLSPEAQELIQYHVYDIDLPGMNFKGRYELLEKLFEQTHLPNLVLVTTSFLHFTPDQFDKDRFLEILDLIHGGYIEKGYEGTIIRWGNEGYEHKRTDKLLKRKDFDDSEFTIVDIVEGVGNRSGMAGTVLCALPNGETFGANPIGGYSVYRDILLNKEKYIGKQATVKYQGLTCDMYPRFAVLKTILD
jgi:DNA ligase-1